MGIEYDVYGYSYTTEYSTRARRNIHTLKKYESILNKIEVLFISTRYNIMLFYH